MSKNSTQEWTKRVFKYDDKTFDTVPDSTSIEDARKLLAAYLPELANATHSEAIKDGVLTVTFHKQATTKGNGNKPQALIQTLSQLEAIDNPTVPLYEILKGQPITLELLEKHSALLQKAADFVEQNLYGPRKMIDQCFNVSPVPANFVPIGF